MYNGVEQHNDQSEPDNDVCGRRPHGNGGDRRRAHRRPGRGAGSDRRQLLPSRQHAPVRVDRLQPRRHSVHARRPARLQVCVETDRLHQGCAHCGPLVLLTSHGRAPPRRVSASLSCYCNACARGYHRRVGDARSGLAVIISYDIYGFNGGRIRNICDQIADKVGAWRGCSSLALQGSGCAVRVQLSCSTNRHTASCQALLADTVHVALCWLPLAPHGAWCTAHGARRHTCHTGERRTHDHGTVSR